MATCNFYINIRTAVSSDVIAYSRGRMKCAKLFQSTCKRQISPVSASSWLRSTHGQPPVPWNCGCFVHLSCFLWLCEHFLQTHSSSQIQLSWHHCWNRKCIAEIGLLVGWLHNCNKCVRFFFLDILLAAPPPRSMLLKKRSHKIEALLPLYCSLTLSLSHSFKSPSLHCETMYNTIRG